MSELLTREMALERMIKAERDDESNWPMLLIAQAEVLEWAMTQMWQRGDWTYSEQLKAEAARLRKEAGDV